MKKLISVLLSIILAFSVAAPAFAAEAEELPTIYVTGAQTNEIYSAENERIYPTGNDGKEIVKQALKPCLEKLVEGMITGDYDPYVQEFNNALAPAFEKVILDKNGEASDGSHPKYHSSTIKVSNKQSGYRWGDFRFWYDWRESPIKSAAELKNYIDRVKEATGKSKVQIIGRCYGANVVSAYIVLYKEHAAENVSDIAYYSSSAWGIDFMSAIFTGELYLDETAISSFVDYYMENKDIIEDEALKELIVTMVELFSQIKVLGLTGDALLKLVDQFKADLIPEAVLACVGSWPSYWAMVTSDKYEKARDFIFAGREEEYAKFIEKTDAYHYEVQLNIDSTMLELQKEGVNFYIFAKYNFPEFPLYKGATTQGDAYTSVYRQSFGANAADYEKIFSDKYISSVEEANRKYISPDKKIDASTCLFPETTWFIKDLHHNDFDPLHNMSFEIMRYDLTVESEKYPQFLIYQDGAISVLTGTDEDATKPEDNRLVSFFRFLKSLFTFIAKLIKGETKIELPF